MAFLTDSVTLSASEMTYIESGGALNSTHSLTHWDTNFTQRHFVSFHCFYH